MFCSRALRCDQAAIILGQHAADWPGQDGSSPATLNRISNSSLLLHLNRRARNYPEHRASAKPVPVPAVYAAQADHGQREWEHEE